MGEKHEIKRNIKKIIEEHLHCLIDVENEILKLPAEVGMHPGDLKKFEVLISAVKTANELLKTAIELECIAEK